MRAFVKMSLLFGAILTPLLTSATEVHVWDKKPIEIKLEVGKERLIHFDDNITPGISNELAKKIRISSAAGTVYITPVQGFSPTRVKFRDTKGELIFIDLFAVRPKGTEVLEDVKIVSRATAEKDKVVYGVQDEKDTVHTDKEILQYAATDLFGPPRLRDNIYVTVSRITKPLELNLIFGGSSAGVFDVKPIKQYRTGLKTLTALLIKNKTGEPHPIVWKDIFPFHVGISAQHAIVQSADQPQNFTVLYVFTDRPLTENPLFQVREDYEVTE